MAQPHQLASLASRIRRAAQELELVSESAFDLQLLYAFDELVDVRLKLLQLHGHLLPGPQSRSHARAECESRELHGDIPF